MIEHFSLFLNNRINGWLTLFKPCRNHCNKVSFLSMIVVHTPDEFLVIQVAAEDADLGPPLHYSFAEGYNHGKKIVIDQLKGAITLLRF